MAGVSSIAELKKALSSAFPSVAIRPESRGILSTGVLVLDAATNVGGIPFGSVVEYFGAWQSGKSTCATHLMANALANDIGVLYLDYEGGFDDVYSAKLGVSKDDDHFIYAHPTSLEEGGNMIFQALESGHVKLVVMDTVAAAATTAQIKADMNDVTVATQARAMASLLRKLSGVLAEQQAIFLGINQESADINNGMARFGVKMMTTPGGNALKFYSHLRVHFQLIGSLKQKMFTTTGDEYDGQWCSRTEVQVVKNKFAAPYRRERFYILFGEGVSNTATLIEAAIYGGAIVKSGSIFKVQKPNFSTEVNIRGFGEAIEYFKVEPQATELLEVVKKTVPELWPAKSLTS